MIIGTVTFYGWNITFGTLKRNKWWISIPPISQFVVSHITIQPLLAIVQVVILSDTTCNCHD